MYQHSKPKCTSTYQVERYRDPVEVERDLKELVGGKQVTEKPFKPTSPPKKRCVARECCV